MSDALENLDPGDLEAEMERQEVCELSPAGIAEQNQHLLQRQQEFRLAADGVAAAWSRRPEVEAVALFGSVAGPLWKEVPRFRAYRRAGIGLWHECKDLDLALWLSSTIELGGLRKAKTRALAEMYQETGIGVASHQVDVFVLAPGTDNRPCGHNKEQGNRRDGPITVIGHRQVRRGIMGHGIIGIDTAQTSNHGNSRPEPQTPTRHDQPLLLQR